MTYKKLYTTFDEDGKSHLFTADPMKVRKILLKEMFNLGPDATPRDIANAPLILPKLPEKKLTDSRVRSIAMKLSCIPKQYRAFYPGYRGEIPAPEIEIDEGQAAQDINPSQSAPGPAKAKKPLAGPKKGPTLKTTHRAS